MNETLQRCLDDLEQRIDPRQEDDLLTQWIDFAHGRFAGALFSPRRERTAAPNVEWPDIRVNAALDDFDQMALQQYRMCSDVLARGDGALLAVRANYGTSVLPSLFGVSLYIMPDEMNTLPTSWPLHDPAAIQRLIDAGIPDLNGGLGAKVFEMTTRFAEIARRYPNIGRCVDIYHPDLQGPMDVCEVVWGSSVFCALLEGPQRVKDFLELIVQTYTAFLRAWMRIVPLCDIGNVHWGLFHRGRIFLRDDSAMNLSPDLFDEFVRPYDQQLLDTFSGGAIHFCGRGDHFIERMSTLRGLYAVNLSQPELNDMEIIFRNTIDKGIPLLELSRATAELALAAGRNLHHLVHST
jgi:hypothetical protein